MTVSPYFDLSYCRRVEDRSADLNVDWIWRSFFGFAQRIEA